MNRSKLSSKYMINIPRGGCRIIERGTQIKDGHFIVRKSKVSQELFGQVVVNRIVSTLTHCNTLFQRIVLNLF